MVFSVLLLLSLRIIQAHTVIVRNILFDKHVRLLIFSTSTRMVSISCSNVTYLSALQAVMRFKGRGRCLEISPDLSSLFVVRELSFNRYRQINLWGSKGVSVQLSVRRGGLVGRCRRGGRGGNK